MSGFYYISGLVIGQLLCFHEDGLSMEVLFEKPGNYSIGRLYAYIYTTVSELVIKNKGEEICNSNLNPYYLLII